MTTITKAISFGTSGHRGIIGEDMTEAHVLAIAQAVADLFKNQDATLCIGYDPRQGNSPELAEGSFTKIIVDTLIKNGINVEFFDSYSPTPLVSWYIKKFHLTGGFILTASHNPGNYNGIKFNPSNGAPSPSELTKQIESKANEYFISPKSIITQQTGRLKKINFDQAFATDLLMIISKFFNVKTINFPITIDAKHGTVGTIWNNLIKALEIPSSKILHEQPRADFGNIEPNPTKFSSLKDLIQEQKNLKAPIAIANDPDGDRHVILDENGQLVTPEEGTVIILDYLLSQHAPISGIASTVASSDLVKKACLLNGLEFDETAVGFKNFAPFLEKSIQQNKIGLAVESSGGFTASFHTLEKCGFLPAVLLMLIIENTKKSLSELKAKINKKYGSFIFKEEEFHFNKEKKSNLITLFQALTQESAQKLTSTPIQSIIKIDGVKLVFANGWVLMRLSGTEPLARIYAESQDAAFIDDLLKFAKQLPQS